MSHQWDGKIYQNKSLFFERNLSKKLLFKAEINQNFKNLQYYEHTLGWELLEEVYFQLTIFKRNYELWNNVKFHSL